MTAPQFDGLEAPAARHALFPKIISGLRDRGLKHVNVLEVGSFMGHSALSWGAAIAGAGLTGTIVCVDPWKPYFKDQDVRGNVAVAVQHVMMTMGHIKRRFDENVAFMPEGVTVVPVQAAFASATNVLGSGRFDVVYLDGSHYYPDIAADIASAAHLLQIDHGVLCGDDMEMTPAEFWPIADEYCRSDTVTLPDGRWLHAGVTRAVGEAFEHDKIRAENGFWWVEA